jgi:uncharacterized HAD superfamily protein
MFMQNFSSLACTQTDLDKFLTIFEENFRIFQENSEANSKKTKPEYAILYLTKQSRGMQNFSSLDCTQTDLDTFLTIFEENFRIFYESLKQILKKNLNLSVKFET